ncbi:MAG: phosphonate ABC transporter, permease protein PhnE [Anaerolineales bacterium]
MNEMQPEKKKVEKPYGYRGLDIPPPLGAALAIVPGLPQMLTGNFTRGFLILFSIVSIFVLSLWRLDDAEVDYSILPPSVQTADLSVPQEEAVTYALLAMFFGVIGYLWNIYDGYVSAETGRGSPPRLGMVFILAGTLIIGAHITEVDVGKAAREIDDVVPRLSQILWPWEPDEILTRDEEEFDGVALFITPCPDDGDVDVEQPSADEGQPSLSMAPQCGQPAGPRQVDGSRVPGTAVTIQGSGFRADEQAQIFIKPESIPEFRPRIDGEPLSVTPDANGNFELTFEMPNFTIPTQAIGAVEVEVIARQTQEVGNPYLVEDFWLALEGIIVTIFLALMATAVGLVLAVPSSFLAARNLMATNPVTSVIYYVVRLVMNVTRSIEPIIWALIAIIWVGPGPFAGVLALTIHTIAALGKLYSESIENIDNGPIEAIQATGANRIQTIVYAVVPQIIPPFVSFTIYRWDINVRMSTIIGAVGGGGIGTILVQWIRLGDYDAVGIAVWMIAIVVTILDYASARIRERYV